ncbi:MAG: hypothetical protein Kow0080_08730 [Candidatus Promineifilaceae bacterium]
MDEIVWLEGFISVASVLEAGSRPVEEIVVRAGKWDGRFRWLIHRAEERDIPWRKLPAEEIDTLAKGKTHGGVLAKVGPRRFLDLPKLIVDVPNPFVVMLDGVEDPFNFGQAVRALYAAGAAGLVVRPRNWTSAAAVVARASAGATERMPMAVAESAEVAAAYFREQGMLVACTAKESAVSLYEADLTQAYFLLIGGEKRGITRSFLRQADVRLAVPYGRRFDHSLGTAVSAGVIAFEMMRQRQ